MKAVTTIIEKASDGGYGIYCPELSGVPLYGYGLTEEEAKENLRDNLEAIKEHYDEENLPLPEVIREEIRFDYKYDFSGFFKTYPIFNVSILAENIGINASLMRKYKNGIAFASPKQRDKIQQGIHSLAEQLSTVRF
ncbi:MAG: type II toxin-antitoxin system HicB family antitoxin [Tannerella sp.]|jgi:predicted RNase H-like HicB family nuclease|nr:type II toxin-antitoxin system HicB family antitoxin [Tannerella sp.]